MDDPADTRKLRGYLSSTTLDRITTVSIVVIADWTAPVSAIGSAVAAVAAVIAIVQAKRAAIASPDAVAEEHRLRVEGSYRALGRSLWAVRQAAQLAREESDNGETLKRLRDEQTALQIKLVVPLWVDLGTDAPRLMDITLSLDSDPVAVLKAASLLTSQLQNAWNRRPELMLSSLSPKAPRRFWKRLAKFRR